MAKLAFLGLGVMGAPMAALLAKAGHDVTVYNRTTSKAEAWVAANGGAFGRTPFEAARGAEIVISCVGNDDDLAEVCIGENGAFKAMKEGSIFIDHTTVSSEISEILAGEGAKSGIGFVDAPVSGGQAGAENGQLSVMCGGDQAVFDRAAPIMNTYSKMCRRMGDTGAGQKTKMVNQICIAGLVQALSEGMNFAEKAGLDVEAVMEVISQGAAGSWQMENRHKTMATRDFDHGFAVDWMRKDLAICMKTAEEIGADLPVTKTVDGYYSEVQNMGGGRWDTSSLLKRLDT